MNNLIEQLEHIQSVYDDNTQANIIIDNLSHVIISDIAKTYSLIKTDEDLNEDFQNKEVIYLLGANISNFENFLVYAQDIAQKYDVLPIEVKNYAFKSKFYAMLRMLSHDICKKLVNCVDDLIKINKKIKSNKII